MIRGTTIQIWHYILTADGEKKKEGDFLSRSPFFIYHNPLQDYFFGTGGFVGGSVFVGVIGFGPGFGGGGVETWSIAAASAGVIFFTPIQSLLNASHCTDFSRTALAT